MDDDDIEIYTDDTRTEVLMTWHGLRMQTERPVVDGPGGEKIRRPNRCLADFVAPRGVKPDYIGLFAVTAGHRRGQEGSRSSSPTMTTTRAIMLKALADRLAEAFAERMHQRVRTEFWGYAPTSRCRRKN